MSHYGLACIADLKLAMFLLILQGWFSRVYLTEHRQTREEIVLKAINKKSVSVDDFLREFQNSFLLSAHANVITVYDVVFQVGTSVFRMRFQETPNKRFKSAFWAQTFSRLNALSWLAVILILPFPASFLDIVSIFKQLQVQFCHKWICEHIHQALGAWLQIHDL